MTLDIVGLVMGIVRADWRTLYCRLICAVVTRRAREVARERMPLYEAYGL